MTVLGLALVAQDQGEPDAMKLRDLVLRLGSDGAEREKARESLCRMGKRIVPILREMLAKETDKALRSQIEQVIDMLSLPVLEGGKEVTLGGVFAHAITWRRDGKHVALPAAGAAVVFDADTWKEVGRIQKRTMGTYSPNGTLFALGNAQGLSVHETDRYKSIAMIRDVKVMSWLDDERIAYLGAKEQVIMLACKREDKWEANEKLVLPPGTWVNQIVASPDGAWLAVSTFEDGLQLYDTKEWKRAASFAYEDVGHGESQDRIRFSPDSKLLVRESWNGEIAAYSAGSWEKLKSWQPNGAHVVFSFSRDSKFLATGGEDGTLRVWRCDRWSEVAATDLKAVVKELSTSPADDLIVVGCGDTLKLFRLRTP